jgi:hypothetical protein
MNKSTRKKNRNNDDGGGVVSSYYTSDDDEKTSLFSGIICTKSIFIIFNFLFIVKLNFSNSLILKNNYIY